ncbi:alpha/beta fold hydrolase [Actinoplanes sp. NPDC049548]|uniref:alpha/beta fold hydrolase n=1 Tax=Actinoplanes sp. NPDC049548 TaxID=3155152 RepID=UPI00344A261D
MTPTRTTTHTIHRPDATPVHLVVDETGTGRPVLLLHGGAGPMSVQPFATLLADHHDARVLVPTHPGFNTTPRPDDVTGVRDLAALYVALLEQLDLHDVTVIGNSIGGWITAEIAALHHPRVTKAIIINGVGIDVPDHPVADFFALSFDELTDRSYYDPDRFRLDPATLTDRQKALMGGNRQAIAVYGGQSMTDPTLTDRLGRITIPTLVLWGQADRIATPDYGRAYAAAIPTARYQPLTDTGHLPQIETPGRTLEAVWNFIDHGTQRPSDSDSPTESAQTPSPTATASTPASQPAPRVAPASKSQMSLMIWAAVFPTLIALQLLLRNPLADAPMALRTLILVTLAVPITVFGLMPPLQRLRALLITHTHRA